MINTSARLRLRMNVQYVVRDQSGNIKSLFQPWSWVASLIRNGWLSPLHAKIPGLFGYWSGSLQVSNLVVDAGKAIVAGLINGVITDFFDYIAVGTGAVAPTAGDTTLGAEIVDSGLARAASTNSRVTTDVTNDTAQLLKLFTVTGTKAVTESGVFDAAAAGNMLCRQTFSAINVVNGDSLQITWKIDVD